MSTTPHGELFPISEADRQEGKTMFVQNADFVETTLSIWRI